ncbi:MAG: hypothetical protein ABH871_04725 [Pseudomonadota bacterium]
MSISLASCAAETCAKRRAELHKTKDCEVCAGKSLLQYEEIAGVPIQVAVTDVKHDIMFIAVVGIEICVPWIITILSAA